MPSSHRFRGPQEEFPVDLPAPLRPAGAPERPPLPRGGAALIVRCALYRGGLRIEVADIPEALADARANGGFVWVGFWAPTEDEFAQIATQFNLPALAVEDAICAHQRPKLEHYRMPAAGHPDATDTDLLFAVLKPVSYRDHDEAVEISEVAVFVGEHFVVTVRHGNTDLPAAARAALEADPERLAHGRGAVLHELLDRTVDQYLEVISSIEADIDEIEEQVFGGDEADHSKRIYLLKREVLEFRRAAAPLVAALQLLSDRPPPGWQDEHRLLLRDVLDHALKVSETLDSFNDVLTDVLQAELAQVSVRQSNVATRQNEDMRRISAWAAIGLVPTMLAGIYGMNFDNMPELRWHYGYFAALAVMAAICLSLYVMFRRKNWL